MVADSGFDAKKDGYKFKNFSSNYSMEGQCFGFSATSILYYDGVLPLNSEYIQSNLGFNYDLSNHNVYLNGKKLYEGIDLKTIESSYINLDDPYQLSKYSVEDIEVIKSIIWWNAIQKSDLMDNAGSATWNLLMKTSYFSNIEGLKNNIEKGPIEVNFGEINFPKLSNLLEGVSYTGHSVVAQRLLQDINDPSIYYLGIYDSNTPDCETYIKVERSYVGIKNIMENLTLDAVNEDYTFDKIFLSYDVRSLETYLNNKFR